MLKNARSHNVKGSEKKKFWDPPLDISWPTPHPSFKFPGNLTTNICVIQLTNRQTDEKNKLFNVQHR